MIYNSIPNNVIIELLYNQLNLEIEFHLINLYNYIQNIPIISHINQLIRFKQYIFLYNQPGHSKELLEKYPKPYYDIEEVKQVIKIHYNMCEIRKNDRIIAIRINKNLINVS
jgi:hypothetical protein